MFLLDTNVISELRKAQNRRTDPNFQAWAKKIHWSDLYLSAISIYELEVGVAQVETYDLVQGGLLRTWLRDKVLVRFASRILPCDTGVALQAAQLQRDRTRQVEDTLIAATALVHRMKIVTRNVKDFEDTGVEVLNPWQAS